MNRCGHCHDGNEWPPCRYCGSPDFFPPRSIVAVTGSRAFHFTAWHELVIKTALSHVTLLVHGACPHPEDDIARMAFGHRSLDALADEVALRFGFPVVRFHADWKKLGRAAGPIRNREMAEWCARFTCPKMLLRFPGGNGTSGCQREFERVQIPIVQVPA